MWFIWMMLESSQRRFAPIPDHFTGIPTRGCSESNRGILPFGDGHPAMSESASTLRNLPRTSRIVNNIDEKERRS